MKEVNMNTLDRNGKVVLNCVMSNLIPIIIGEPGVGKTAVVKKIAKILDMDCKVILGSTLDPTEFGGFPLKTQRENITVVEAVPPAWVIDIVENDRKGKGTIVFLDELTTAPPAVHAVLLTSMLENRVGDFRLPESTRWIAACNPPEIAPQGIELSPPMANRFCHVYWNVDIKSWIENFPSYWGDEPQIDGIDLKAWRKARVLVAGFINSHRGLLFDFPKDESKQSGAWASPRTWDMLSRALATVKDIDILATIAIGLVGEGPGSEFINFLKYMNLPKPEEVIKKGEFPEKLSQDQAFVLLNNISLILGDELKEAKEAKQKRDSKEFDERMKNVKRILKVIDDAAGKKASDLAFLAWFRYQKDYRYLLYKAIQELELPHLVEFMKEGVID